MARPKIDIDQELFEELCALQCTKPEFCAALKVNEKTLTAWCKRTYRMGFYEIFSIKRQNGKISLRRNQMKLSEKSDRMAIWLGRNMLGQSETGVVEQDIDDQGQKSGLIAALEASVGEVWDDEKAE